MPGRVTSPVLITSFVYPQNIHIQLAKSHFLLHFHQQHVEPADEPKRLDQLLDEHNQQRPYEIKLPNAHVL